MAKVELDYLKTQAKLKNLKDSYKNMEELFRNIADLELSSTLLRYKDEEKPDGTKWRDPISTRGRGKDKRPFDRGLGDKVLIDSGILLGSIQRVFGEDYAEVGTNMKYGGYVQALGFTFLGVNDQTRDNVREAYKAFIKGVL